MGGSLPDQRLRRIRGHALSLARLDRPVLDALTAADPASQRQLARWVTRRGFTEARLVEVDWIAPALAAMDRGEPLPAPLDDQQRAWNLLLSDSQVRHTTATSPDGTLDNCLQQAMAFPAIFATQHEDPLRAAVDALWAACAGHAFESDRVAEPCRTKPHLGELCLGKTGSLVKTRLVEPVAAGEPRAVEPGIAREPRPAEPGVAREPRPVEPGVAPELCPAEPGVGREPRPVELGVIPEQA